MFFGFNTFWDVDFQLHNCFFMVKFHYVFIWFYFYSINLSIISLYGLIFNEYSTKILFYSLNHLPQGSKLTKVISNYCLTFTQLFDLTDGQRPEKKKSK